MTRFVTRYTVCITFQIKIISSSFKLNNVQLSGLNNEYVISRNFVGRISINLREEGRPMHHKRMRKSPRVRTHRPLTELVISPNLQDLQHTDTFPEATT